MKNVLSLFLVIVAVFSLAACGATEDQWNSASAAFESSSAVMEQEMLSSDLSETSKGPENNVLMVAYFS